MQIFQQSLPEVLVVQPSVHRDYRGYFMELYHQKRYGETFIKQSFVQDNLSRSVKGTLRGLHYQVDRPQAKLVQVIRGEIFDVAVDIRLSSPTFGQWLGVVLSDRNGRQIFVPEGFAHGFCVLSKTADVMYKCTDFYMPEDEGGILWSDPELGIGWPVKNPLLSFKDGQYPRLCDVPTHRLPTYKAEVAQGRLLQICAS